MDISTQYMGIKLPNPIIVSSSSLTASVKGVQEACRAGAGAVVLKSLFEEDIAKANSSDRMDEGMDPEALLYLEQMNMLYEPDTYLNLVEGCVQSVDIPVIASLNCNSVRWWVDYVERIAGVGAHAIELNLSPIALDYKTSAQKIEDKLVDMVVQARNTVSIPLAVKLGPHYSALPNLAIRLRDAGANALTLFNRYYTMDINIDTMELKSGNTLSAAEEFSTVLRWIGILAETPNLDFSASTGIYDPSSLIKVLLAGGSAAQLCSVLYRNGLQVIQQFLDSLKEWMISHKFQSLNDFRGKLSMKDDQRNDFYQRLQYVKAIKG
ncbi:MAG: hypothetical protein B0D92_04245 [Spirochaeta sp. LUC14_002_19_P3]|nr:MAG: hypothetical protein B0D92_04245 [Spirochaeta sp. LUC14_002_19_P3]